MQHVVADTNVFISFFMERNETQRAAAKSLFLAAENGDFIAVVPQFVLFEIVYVLQTSYGVPATDVASVLKDAMAMPGVLVTDDCPWRQILGYWPDRLRSISDAALLAVAVNNQYDYVATFDRQLAKRMKSLGAASYW